MSKVYGFRMDDDTIKKFHNACNDLPVKFKPNELLKSYVEYIIQTAENYKKTGQVKLGFVMYDKNIVLLNLEGEQVPIIPFNDTDDFDESKFERIK